jgi:hypothetical protein
MDQKLGYPIMYYANSKKNLQVLFEFGSDPNFETNELEFKTPLHHIICNSNYSHYSDQIEIYKYFYDLGFDFERKVRYLGKIKCTRLNIMKRK